MYYKFSTGFTGVDGRIFLPKDPIQKVAQRTKRKWIKDIWEI